MAERKPVVVIYDDENVIECLSQELINAVVASAKADLLKGYVGSDYVTLYDSNYKTRLSIDKESVYFSLNEKLALDEELANIRKSMIESQIAEKEKEIAALQSII